MTSEGVLIADGVTGMLRYTPAGVIPLSTWWSRYCVPLFFACSSAWTWWDPHWLAVQRREMGRMEGQVLWRVSRQVYTKTGRLGVG